MKSKILLAVMSIVALVGVVTLVPGTVGATPASEINKGAGKVDSGGPKLEDSFKIIANMILFVLGAISVIMIIVGGIKYTTSNGDAGSIKSAKDTIMYSVVGLVVAMLAYAIVNFVVDAFK